MLKKNSVQLLSDWKWLKSQKWSCELCHVYLIEPRDLNRDGEGDG